MKPVVIIIHETVRESWLRDAGSLLAAIVLIGVGTWVGSTTMEWVGAFIFMLTLFTGVSSSTRRKTPQEAADFLAEKFQVRAKP